MKTNRQIITERKLLAKMDERKRLEKNYLFLHSVKDDLFKACNPLSKREPELCEQLWQVCLLIHERCEAIYSLKLDLQRQIDKSYADLLVQEADANESIPPAMQVMLPPCLERIS